MRDPSTGIIIGHCRYPDDASVAIRLLGAYENAKAEYVTTHGEPSQRFAYGNNMAVRASVFEEIGPFKEWSRAADSELVHRMAASRPDLRVAYSGATRIMHMEFVSARARAQRLALYAHTNSQISTFRELSARHRIGILGQLLRQLVS
jgi:hypothetical protein